MDKYLYNRLIKLIASKSPMEVDFYISYDCDMPRVLSPKEIDEQFNEIINFNFGKVTGLKKIINYFTL